MVMVSNDASGRVHYFAGKYPGKIGWCISPDGWKNPPTYMPYALDNGSFIDWQPALFMEMLCKSTKFHRPLFIVVPDMVADPEITLRKWHYWHLRIAPFGPLAFACQDGMEPENVPQKATCCFIGGTTRWKLKNAHRFKGISPCLHIGRVNTYQRLRWAEEIGADSVDGTGWFRGDKDQRAGLIEWFEQKQGNLFNEFQLCQNSVKKQL